MKPGVMDQAFYRTILDSLNEGVYFVNRKRQVLYWNKAAEELSGYSLDDVLGKCCAENRLNHVDDAGNHLCKQGCPLMGTMRDGQPREVNVFMHHKSGQRIPVNIRSLPIFDEDGKISGSIEIFSENSKQRDFACEVEALRHDALTDPLSGVGNRRQIDASLAIMETAWRVKGAPFGVLFIDIDHFKTINDTYGHAVGDQVIQTISRTLSAALRSGDIVGRWGGDELVVLLPNSSPEGLSKVGARLVHLIRESWIDLDGEIVSFTVSIGGALIENDTDDIKSVLDRADEQLYLSKNGGRNCFHFDG